jgi:hypothetical protein
LRALKLKKEEKKRVKDVRIPPIYKRACMLNRPAALLPKALTSRHRSKRKFKRKKVNWYLKTRPRK